MLRASPLIKVYTLELWTLLFESIKQLEIGSHGYCQAEAA